MRDVSKILAKPLHLIPSAADAKIFYADTPVPDIAFVGANLFNLRRRYFINNKEFMKNK